MCMLLLGENTQRLLSCLIFIIVNVDTDEQSQTQPNYERAALLMTIWDQNEYTDKVIIIFPHNPDVNKNKTKKSVLYI